MSEEPVRAEDQLVADDLAKAPEWRSDVGVELVKASASDSDVVFAARVSTAGEQSIDAIGEDPERSAGLIRYLMRARHGSPYEHNSMTFLISAPIFVFREFHRHRIGWCVAGDTKITFETNGGQSGRTLRHQPIEDVYRRWHEGVRDEMPFSKGLGIAQARDGKWNAYGRSNGRQLYLGRFDTADEAATVVREARLAAGPTYRTRLLPQCRKLSVRVLNEETQHFETARVLDIYDSGVKEVIEIAADGGRPLRCSTDHAIYTNAGWVKAGDLDPQEHLVTVAGTRSLFDGRQYPPSLRAGIGVWTSMQRNSLIKPFDHCYLCGQIFEREELVLDHVVPVVADLSQALDPKNIRPACEPCHRIKTNSEQKMGRRGMTAGAKFVRFTRSRVPVAEVQTYDLAVEGPWHSFMANGLVVHNSYNEESGRYRELEPVFYLPGPERKLTQTGKPGHYVFVDGTPEQYETTVAATKRACETAYAAYQEMLAAGIAREVARGVLPVGIYSSMYATCNARSLMAFLSLRTKREDSTFPSYPQREIEMVAEKMEAEWAKLMPITHAAFDAAGRVSP